MEPGRRPHNDEKDEKEKEHDDRRPPPAAATPQSLKRSLVKRFKQAGIHGYEVTHNTLFELREKHAQTEEDRREQAREDLARLAQGTRSDPVPDSGADGNAASTPGWKSHSTRPSSVEECWNLVSRRAMLEKFEYLRMFHPLFRTEGWVDDAKRVELVGQRFVQLIKDRVLRLTLARRIGPEKAAADLDDQIRHLFEGDITVGTGRLPALLEQAIKDVVASTRSATDPLARDSDIGRSRRNQ